MMAVITSIVDFVGACRQVVRKAGVERGLRRRFPNVTFGQGVLISGTHRFLGSSCVLELRGRRLERQLGFIRLGHNCEIGPCEVLWGAGGISGRRERAHRRSSHHCGAPGATYSAGGYGLPAAVGYRVRPRRHRGPHAALLRFGRVPGVRIGHHSMIRARSWWMIYLRIRSRSAVWQRSYAPDFPIQSVHSMCGRADTRRCVTQ
jgi:hypothetical protein